MRAFIAIAIDEVVLREIGGFIRTLSAETPAIRWTAPSNIHLTMKFLGDTEERITDRLVSKLRKNLHNHSPFDIEIIGAGAFPDFRSPRILWVGVSQSEPLNRIFSALEDACLEFGFEKEKRRFSPHITIGRVKDSLSSSLVEILKKHNDRLWGTVHVSEVRLMKSLLKPTGPEYSVVSVVKLSDLHT